MKLNLNINHINRLFDLTDRHLEWYDKYYPNSTTFSKLLKRNYNNLYYFCLINNMGDYDDDILNDKLDNMFEAYDNLVYITKINKLTKKRDKV